MSRIIVVGANHAGTACINTILANKQADDELVVYDRNFNISFLGCGMALWIGKQIAGAEGLFYSSAEKLTEGGAQVFMEHEVEHIDFAGKTLTVKDLKTGEVKSDSFDKLVLATGSLPILPNIPGADLENVQQVKLYQNAQEVIDKLANPNIKRVAVVGAGYIGVELAEAFERCNKEVVLLDLADTSLSGYYDPEFSALMDKELSDHGIKLAYGEKLLEIKGEGKVSSIVTDKAEYPADMVILAIGFKPNSALAKDALECLPNGAICINRHQQTSQNDVYAVGDCAHVFDNATDQPQYIALATNAVRSGIVAGLNVCGTPAETIGVQGSNGINIYSLKMVSTGLSERKAKLLGFDVKTTSFEDLQKPAFMESENAPVKIKIVYDAKTRVILGCQMASTYDISMGIHLFSLAIQEKVTIDKLALTDIFFLPHFNQPYNYITMAAYTAE